MIASNDFVDPPGDKPGGRRIVWKPTGILGFFWRCAWLVYQVLFFVPFALFWCGWHSWKRCRVWYFKIRAAWRNRQVRQIEKEILKELEQYKD